MTPIDEFWITMKILFLLVILLLLLGYVFQEPLKDLFNK